MTDVNRPRPQMRGLGTRRGLRAWRTRRDRRVNMGSLPDPARSRRALAKGETRGVRDGMGDDRGAEVPKKRVTIVEGSVPVIDKRKGETGGIYTAERSSKPVNKTRPHKAKIAARSGSGVQQPWAPDRPRNAAKVFPQPGWIEGRGHRQCNEGSIRTES